MLLLVVTLFCVGIVVGIVLDDGVVAVGNFACFVVGDGFLVVFLALILLLALL